MLRKKQLKYNKNTYAQCWYPDWEGGWTVRMHNFDKYGDCIICGKQKNDRRNKS